MPATHTAVPTDRLSALVDAGRFADAVRLAEAEVLPALADQPDDPALAPAAVLAAEAYRESGRGSDAERFFLDALRVERANGPTRGNALRGLGVLYQRQQLFDRALELFASAADCFRAGPPDPAGLALSLERRADTLHELGRRRAAVATLKEARRVVTDGGSQPIPMADLLIAEARVLLPVEGCVATLERVKKAVALRERHSGHEHYETGYAHYLLGSTLAMLEDLKAAATHTDTAKKALAATVGETHPMYVTVLQVQAVLRASAGDVRTGERLTRQALELTRREFGDAHTWTADAHRMVGVVHQFASRFTEADECMSTAVRITRERYGETHPNTISLRLDVAQLREVAGAMREATELTRGAVADLERWPDDTRHEQASARLSLVRLLADAGDSAAAEAEARRVVELAAEVGDDPLLAAPALFALAGFALQRGDETACRDQLAAGDLLLGPLPPGHPSRLQADGLRASLEWGRGNPATAIALAKSAVRRAEGTLGLPAALCFLGEQAHHAGDLPQAEAAYERALGVQRQADQEHPDQAATLRGLARVHLSRGNPAAAEVRFRRAHDLRRAALGDRHPSTAESLADVASLAQQAGDLRAAEGMFREVADVRRDAYGPSHPETVNALHSLAIVLWGRNELNAAVTTIEDALAPLPDTHPDRGPLRHTLAQVYHARGELGRAVELLADVQAGYEKAFGADNERLQPVLLDLARCHTALGDGLEARRLLVRVRAMLRGSQYPRPLDEASTLISLSDSHRNLGDPERALAGSNEALAMVRRSLPPNDPGLLDYLTHAAESARIAKQFGRAAGLLAEAERIVLAAGGERHPIRGRVWLERAALEAARGQVRQAGGLYEQAVNLAKTVLGEDHPDHATTRRLAGMHCLAVKQFQAAEGHLRTRLAIVRRTLGDDHPTVALAQQAVAEVLRQAGNLRVAEDEAREAEATLRRSDVPADALHAAALHGLGVIVRQQGRLPEAARFFERALEIDRTTAAQEEQAGSLDTHYQLALIEAASGDHPAAVARLRRLLADQEGLMSAFACVPAGPNRDGLLKYPQQLVGMLLTLTAGHPEQSLPVADVVVKWNALTPGELAYGDRAALRGQHPADAEAIDRLFDLNIQIAQRHFSGAGLEGMALHRELMAKWTSERDRLELELCDRVQPLARFRAWREVDVTAIRTRLPADTAAIELIRYHTTDFHALCREEDKVGPVRYAAVVIHPTNEPKVIDLGGAEAIDGQKLHATVPLHLAGCSKVIVGHGGLTRRVWAGLAKEVKGVRSCRELVSPLLAAPPGGFLARVRGWFGWG